MDKTRPASQLGQQIPRRPSCLNPLHEGWPPPAPVRQPSSHSNPPDPVNRRTQPPKSNLLAASAGRPPHRPVPYLAPAVCRGVSALNPHPPGYGTSHSDYTALAVHLHSTRVADVCVTVAHVETRTGVSMLCGRSVTPVLRVIY